MEASNWIAFAGIVSTATVSIATLLLNRQNHREQIEREDLIRERARKNVPHIEFHIDCNVYGPEDDNYLTEFLLDIHNRGDVQHKFKNIILRVRGIESEKALCYWEGYEPRLSFPKKVLDDVSFIPKGYNYFFVEPGVKQVLTYVTMIPATIKYVLAHAVFEYDEFTPHTAERVFELNPKPIKPLTSQSDYWRNSR